MKTALIFCPYVAILNIPPLAPALLKSCLNRDGYPAITFDFNLAFQTEFCEHRRTAIITWITTPDMSIDFDHFQAYQDFVMRCTQRILESAADAVGISVFSHESQRFAEDLSYHLRLQRPEIYVMVGGSGVNVKQNFYGATWAELAVESGLVDSVLIGEGEMMITQMIKNRIRGIVSTPQIDNEELADLPVPNFDDYDLNMYGPRDKLQLPVTASKGCVRSCVFCDVASIWPKFRYRRGENVAEEMIEIYRRYGIKNFAFTDSLINGGLRPFREMNQILSDRLPKTIHYSGQFICRSKKDMPERDFILMRQGGCSLVSIGIESGSELVRAHMKKQFTNQDLDYTVHELLQNNIQQRWNIIVGYPTETDQDWQLTLDLIDRYSAYHDTIKITPTGVFQMLQNTPITSPQMLEDLDIDMHIINGYSEYGWLSKTNPTNDFRTRFKRWQELAQMIKDLDMIPPSSRLDQKTLVIKQQLSYYENQPNNPVFEIRKHSIQDPTNLDYQ